MEGTRDRILEAALRLFARDGFEAVSTSAIASELGMTKGALYRHFSDKRAIFDSLVDEMLEQHREAIISAGIGLDGDGGAARAYAAATPKDMVALGEALFARWTGDGPAAEFRRMLSIERHRDARAAEVFDELFAGGMLRYHARLFSEMTALGALRAGDPMQMALEFWGPVILLMQASDGGMDADEAAALVREHIRSFAARYALHPTASMPEEEK